MELFTESDLRDHIGNSRIFSRGKNYCKKGVIKNLKATESFEGDILIEAMIEGSDWYETEIIFDSQSGEIYDSNCSCPYWDKCKHIAGLGLYALNKKDFTQEDESASVVSQASTSNENIFSAFRNIQKTDIKDSEELLTPILTSLPEFYLYNDFYEGVGLVACDGRIYSDNIIQSISLPAEKFVWQRFFSDVKHQEGDSKFFLSPDLVDAYFSFLLEKTVIVNENNDLIILEKAFGKLHLEIEAGKDFMIYLAKGQLIIGQKRAWLSDENSIWELSSNIPIGFLQQIKNKAGWEVSAFQQSEVENLLVPFLEK